MSTGALDARSRAIARPRDMLLMMILMIGVALGITAIFGRPSLWVVVLQGTAWPVQVACGTGIGLLLSLSIMVPINRIHWFEAFRRQLIEIVSHADLNGFNPVWFSLCAGVGEELLIRGTLQPILGLWLTSLLFTALHFQTGGFRTMNRMKAVYALVIFFVSLLLGAVFIRIGLIAAIVTHVVGDIVFLTSLRTVRSLSAVSQGQRGVL
jgi:hypothetical protein